MILLEVYGVIYGIECLQEHLIYIGQTTQKLNRRISQHKACTRSLIGKTIQEYGWKNNFICLVLEKCSNREELDEAEQRWIAKFNCQFPNGYNLTSGGKLHCKYNEESLKNLSASLKGRKFSDEALATHKKIHGERLRTLDYRMNTSIKEKKIIYPNLENEIEKQMLTHAELARSLNVRYTMKTIMGKLNNHGAVMDLETAIAIKEFLGVDMPLEELFKKKDDAE